ncbi:MAG: CcdB family protein [Kofleriaceae bacterium]
MAQFDLYATPKGIASFLVDLQSDTLARLETRIVAPLVAVRRHEGKPVARLHPVVTLKGAAYLVVMDELAAVDSHLLGSRVGSLAHHRSDLIAALDLLFTGI